MSAPKPVSNWWYILPILLGIVGALIAWICIRRLDSSKARKIIIVGLITTLIGGVSGDYLIDPWFDELETVDLWCANQFDLAISNPVMHQDSIVMLKNGCFTHFDSWKHLSVSINDGTAEKFLDEEGTSISEVVQLNVQREQGLN